jgi:hypothetical protein
LDPFNTFGHCRLHLFNDDFGFADKCLVLKIYLNCSGVDHCRLRKTS